MTLGETVTIDGLVSDGKFSDDIQEGFEKIFIHSYREGLPQGHVCKDQTHTSCEITISHVGMNEAGRRLRGFQTVELFVTYKIVVESDGAASMVAEDFAINASDFAHELEEGIKQDVTALDVLGLTKASDFAIAAVARPPLVVGHDTASSTSADVEERTLPSAASWGSSRSCTALAIMCIAFFVPACQS